MDIIVLKFGGTSLDTPQKREKSAKQILAALGNGFFPVVVVSAIGRKGKPYATDTLIDFALEANASLEAREKDLLMSCGEIISAVIMVQTLKSYNFKAKALTGAQAGIITDNQFGESNIESVKASKVLNLIEDSIIPVIAGFQGISAHGEITTLGRGGSDTTAAVMAAAVNAKFIEIYTDVAGVMTADPSKVNEARTIEKASYNEVCELAYQGARVIHPRAAEIAMQENIPIKIKTTDSQKAGTVINKYIKSDRPVTGVTSRSDIIFVKIFSSKEKEYATELKIFKILADNKISVDFINIRPEAISFIVKKSLKEKIINILNNTDMKFQVADNFVKVSVVGGGMTGRPGIMARIVEALKKNKIAIYQTTDSHTTISCLLAKNVEKIALNTLHNTFNLHNFNN